MEKAKRKEITVGSYLRVNHKDAAGTAPVKLKLTAYRKTKMYPIQLNSENIRITPKEWDSITAKNARPRGLLKDILETTEQAKAKARDAVKQIMKGNKPFTFEAFEKAYFSNTEGITGFLGTFKAYNEKILAEERIGTYKAYKNAYDAFHLFLKGKDISPYELTLDMLKNFEAWLKKERQSEKSKGIHKAGATTVGIYMRTLRIVYNLCADADPGLKLYYPFGSGRNKFKISDTRKGGKKGDALTAEQVKTFVSTITITGSLEWEAKLYWLFSFYCQGMNFRDIAHLRWQNIQGEFIRYTREKTKRTEALEIQEVFITEPIKEIISLLAKGRLKSEYVFPIIPETEMDLLRIEAVVKQKLKIINKYLRILCASNGLPKITTYWSRHTYASLLKISGVSVEMIRELLGHSDMRTTEHYLKRFDASQKINVNRELQSLISPGVSLTREPSIMSIELQENVG
jgi:integrase/recombinase XerD